MHSKAFQRQPAPPGEDATSAPAMVICGAARIRDGSPIHSRHTPRSCFTHRCAASTQMGTLRMAYSGGIHNSRSSASFLSGLSLLECVWKKSALTVFRLRKNCKLLCTISSTNRDNGFSENT